MVQIPLFLCISRLILHLFVKILHIHRKSTFSRVLTFADRQTVHFSGYLACQPILFLISISIFRKYEISLPVVPGFKNDKKIKKIHFYSAKWLILKTGVTGKYYIIIDRTGKNCQFLKIKIKARAHQFENNTHNAL